MRVGGRAENGFGGCVKLCTHIRGGGLKTGYWIDIPFDIWDTLAISIPHERQSTHLLTLASLHANTGRDSNQ